MPEDTKKKLKTKCLDNGIDFQVYYSESNFRVCTVSRVVGMKKSTKDLVMVHVDPCDSLAIEIVDKTTYTNTKAKTYYLVVAFVRYQENGEIFIEEVDNRVKDLGFINKIRYNKARKAAISTMKKLHKEKKQ